MRTLTILNRFDIDIDWGFSALSLGFHISKHSIGLSLLFVDINAWYISHKRRVEIEERYGEFFKQLEDAKDQV